MFLTNLFNKKCQHEHITPDKKFGYCPTCGELIENEWFITRCSCCGVKLKAMLKNGHVVPQYHYCTNCGNTEFSIEKLEKINFIDINFAVLVKSIKHDTTLCKTTSFWQERTIELPKLPLQSR